MATSKYIIPLGPTLISQSSDQTDGYTLLLRNRVAGPSLFIDTDLTDAYGLEFSGDGYIGTPRGTLVLESSTEIILQTPDADGYVTIEGKGLKFEDGPYGFTKDGYGVLKNLHLLNSTISSTGSLVLSDSSGHTQLSTILSTIGAAAETLQQTYTAGRTIQTIAAQPVDITSASIFDAALNLEGYCTFDNDGYVVAPSGKLRLHSRSGEMTLQTPQDSYTKIEGYGIKFNDGPYGVTRDGYAVFKNIHLTNSTISSESQLRLDGPTIKLGNQIILTDEMAPGEVQWDFNDMYWVVNQFFGADIYGPYGMYFACQDAGAITLSTNNGGIELNSGAALSLLSGGPELTTIIANDALEITANNADILIQALNGIVIESTTSSIDLISGSGNTIFLTSGSNISASADGGIDLSSNGGDISLLANSGTDSIVLSAAGNAENVYINSGLRLDRLATAVSANNTWRSIIGVTSTAAARTITLLNTTKISGHICIVKDESGAAATNNITVTPETGTIDGVASFIINTNHGVGRFYTNGTNWFSF